MATVGALAKLVGGEVHGDSDRAVDDLADLSSAGPRHLSFLANPRYLKDFQQTRAAAVLVGQVQNGTPCTQIVCADPYLAMAQVATALHPPRQFAAGVHPDAHVSPEAQVDPTACVRPGAVVDEGARVGARTVLDCGSYVGARAVVGDDCLLHSGSRVLDRCVLGDRVILQAGAIIGSDGFGYAVDKATGRRHKIPQVGIAVLEDDVEIGANSTVDRATFGVTRIGAGSKVDNLVQLAHNVVLGRDCVIVSQTGIAGSTELGDRVIVGAQGGLVGHVKLADDVVLAARAGVHQNIDKPGVYSGAPCMPHRQWLKTIMTLPQLPELRRRLRELEARIASTSV